MSDQWGPDRGDGTERPEWAGADGPPPPPPPPPSAGVQPALTLESEGAVGKRPGGVGGRAAVAIIGVLLLVGGTLFAVTQVGSSGPGSAEEAVQEMLDAVAAEDVVGMLAALDPGERDALRPPVEDLFEELKRLEVVDPSLELTGIQGFDFLFEDVVLRSEPVRDDLVRVYFDGGTMTSSVTGEELPIGDFVADTLERFDTDISELDESETQELQADDTFFVARNGDDGWRVSIGYTLAELARIDAGVPLPAPGITPIGADSPTAAVDGMARAMADLDLRGMIARLSPAEMAALQDYAGLFIDEAEAEMAEEAASVDVTIDDLVLRAEEDGDRASVFIDRVAFTVVVEGESVSIEVDESCLTVSGPLVEEDLRDTPFEDGPVCADDMAELYQDMLGMSGLEDSDVELPSFPAIETPSVGITTMQVDGQWYVAPVSTYMDGAVSVLRVLERSHLDAFVDFVEEMMGAFMMPTEETFSEVGESIPDDFGETGESGEFEFESESELGSDGPIDFVALEELALAYTGGDRATADCVVQELALAPWDLVLELTDAWTYEYQPEPEAEQLLLDTIDVCSGR